MKKLYVKVADTPEKREIGLMGKKNLPENQGMFFKFPTAHRLRFWMKNTYIPLDIAFLDNDGEILQIESMYPLSTRAITSNYICKYALEVNAGWFDKNEVKPGHYIKGKALPKNIVQAQVVKKDDSKKKREKDANPDRPSLDNLPKADVEVKEDVPEIETGEQIPEAGVEGNYPQSIYTEPVEEGVNPNVQIMRDMRGKIKFAEDHNLEMEIVYWTKRGHMLPPRRVRQLEGEGYVLKTGPTGEMLVAFDASPTIQGDGWSIKGMQPKSFILDNIIEMTLFDEKGQALTDERLSQIKEQEKNGPVQVPQAIPEQQKEKGKGFWNMLKNKLMGR